MELPRPRIYLQGTMDSWGEGEAMICTMELWTCDAGIQGML